MLRAFLFKGKDKQELIGQVVNILVWKRMLGPPFLRAGCDRKKETYSGIDMGKKNDLCTKSCPSIECLSDCEQDRVSPMLQSLGDTHNTLTLSTIRSCIERLAHGRECVGETTRALAVDT